MDTDRRSAAPMHPTASRDNAGPPQVFSPPTAGGLGAARPSERSHATNPPEPGDSRAGNALHQDWMRFGRWRAQRLTHLDGLLRWLRESGIDPALWHDALLGLDQRLRQDVVQLAFVAEYARGKSELINAIFFAGSGRRMLPAAPGRTTMCPMEMRADAQQPRTLRLLPIDTRVDPTPLAQWKERPRAWVELRIDDDDAMERALARLADTIRIDAQRARQLGFDVDDAGGAAPDSEGMVVVPRWRHALLHIEHELLAQGLSVLDTPGLNAVGAEPELTLSLIPGAHAVLFLLGADTGVTRSDLELWNQHVGAAGRARSLVVLNKIDMLWDPLRTAAEVDAQIEAQCVAVAQVLQVPRDHVFALSAHKALLARIRGDAALLQRSGLPALEAALGRVADAERRELIDGGWRATLLDTLVLVERQLQQQVEQIAAQVDELDALQGRNRGLLAGLRRRVHDERAEFESGLRRAQALHAVNARQLGAASALLDPVPLLAPLLQLRERLHDARLKTGLRDALQQVCAEAQHRVRAVERQLDENRAMLGAAFDQLNTEFAFGLPTPKPLRLEGIQLELAELQRNYLAYLSPAHWLRLQRGHHALRLLDSAVGRLRAALERAQRDVQAWNRAALASLDAQLRERRRGLARRTQNLEQVDHAGADLVQRVAALRQQHDELRQRRAQARRHFEGVLS